MAAHVQSRPAVAVPSPATVAYAAGAALLAVEAAVHVQQYASILHAVRWVGPLFLANALACFVVVAGLASHRTRAPAALAGIVVSVVALGSLAVSYGQGLFGWQEGGFRTPVALAVIAEVGAVVVLAAALALPAHGADGAGGAGRQP
jgi:hypothetical protein